MRPFDRRTQNACVGALRRCSRHDRREILADALGQHRRAGNFAHRALDFSRRLATLGAATRNLGELLIGVRRRSTRRNRAQHPLRDEIREPAIRRGGVHVVRDSEPEMAGLPAIAESTLEDVDAGAEEFDDGERQIREVIGIGRAAAGEKLGESNVVRFFRKFLADVRRQRHDAIPSLGLAHDSTQRRRSSVQQIGGDGSVRGHHEILDHVASAIAAHNGQIHDLSVRHHRSGFDALEVERARNASRAAQQLCGFVLDAKLLVQRGRGDDRRRRRPLALEPEADGFVSELRLIAHQRAVHRGVAQRSVGTDVEFDDDGKTILGFVQRREIAREPVGQHRKYRDAGVDGGRVLGGVLVRGGAEVDERVDVGDANADSDRAIRRRAPQLRSDRGRGIPGCRSTTTADRAGRARLAAGDHRTDRRVIEPPTSRRVRTRARSRFSPSRRLRRCEVFALAGASHSRISTQFVLPYTDASDRLTDLSYETTNITALEANGAITPIGADPKHFASFRSIRVQFCSTNFG